MPYAEGVTSQSQSRRISRRAIIAGLGVAGAGGAGAFALLNRNGESPPAVPTVEPTVPVPTASPAPTALPTATTPPRVPQGEARLVSPRLLNFDTFDSVRTGEASVLEVLGRTHARLLRWSASTNIPLVEGDLAASWETPDELTWLFSLDESRQWNGGERLPARPVTAVDVMQHFSRVVQLAREDGLQQVQRPWEWLSVESVDSPGDGLVRIQTTQPEPFLPNILAGAFALVMRPEAVEHLETADGALLAGNVSGSGSFIFDGFDDARRLSFRPAAGDPRAAVQRVRVAGPGWSNASFVEHQLDEFITRDRRDAAAIREAVAGVREQSIYEDAPVISTLAVGAPPWSDPRLRTALSVALNRTELIQRLFGGRAEPSGPVPPAHRGYALDDASLQSFAGFRDFETDAADARAAWDAAAGDALGEITVEFPASFDPRYSASSVVTGMLREVLGAAVTARVDSYVNISRKALDGYYGNGRAALWFGWGPALVSPDPSLNLFETFHGESATARSLGHADPGLDAQLLQLRLERDAESRVALVHEIQRAILAEASGGVMHWALQRSEHFSHGYLASPLPSPFAAQVDPAAVVVDVDSADYPADRLA